MLSLLRPPAHAEFAADAIRHLDDIRKVAGAGALVTSGHFEYKKLWHTEKYKRALVGDPLSPTKCAWCERHNEWRRQLDVEHYRPKAKVTEWEGAPPEVSDVPPRQLEVSGGYWWLAFDWQNYSLACGPCNQHWKRNLFPVVVREPYAEGMERTENPLLIDPLSAFRTADHFRWDDGGYMWGVSARGRATIITCGLNRTLLPALRRRTARNVGEKLEELRRALRSGALLTAQSAKQSLGHLGAETSEFAGMVRWIVEDKLRRPWAEVMSK